MSFIHLLFVQTTNSEEAMQVSLSSLRAFESAARLGSFKAAATELSITPTAVSHHINNLEQRLTVTLFTREARKVTLTELGKILADATTQGFTTIDSAITEIATKGKQINVSTTSSFAALVLIPALQGFYSQCPGTKVNIASGETIKSESYNLPIRLGQTEMQSCHDVIKHEQFNLFASVHANLQLAQVKTMEIYTTDWKNNELPSVPLTEWLQLNGLQKKNVNVTYFDQELFGIQQALVEHAFVFCSKTLVRDYLKAGMMVELETQSVNSQLCYYIKNKKELTSRHNFMFIDWLEKIINQ